MLKVVCFEWKIHEVLFYSRFFVCERCKVALNQNKPHSFIPRKRKKVRLTVLSWNCSRLDFFLSLRIGSVCTVHVAHTRTLYSWSRKCLHLSVYMCWGSTGINKETEIQLCLKEEKKHTAAVWSQTHIVSIALDNIILHHLQGEISANIMGNPVKEPGGWVWVRGCCDGNTASSKFSGLAVSSGVISIFSNSLSFPPLTITAKTLHLLRRLTGAIQPGTGWIEAQSLQEGLVQSQDGDRHTESVRETERDGAAGEIFLFRNCITRNVRYNNRNVFGQYILSKCQRGILGYLMQS